MRIRDLDGRERVAASMRQASRMDPGSRRSVLRAGDHSGPSRRRHAYDAGFMWSAALSDYRVPRRARPRMYAVDSVRDKRQNADLRRASETKGTSTPTDMVNTDEYRRRARVAARQLRLRFTNSYFDVQFCAR